MHFIYADFFNLNGGQKINAVKGDIHYSYMWPLDNNAFSSMKHFSDAVRHAVNTAKSLQMFAPLPISPPPHKYSL